MTNDPSEFTDFAGVDVGAEELVLVVYRDGNGRTYEQTYSNDPKGVGDLVEYLTDPGNRVRVCFEATGRYHLDLALSLDVAGLTVPVVPDPGRMRRYAESLDGRGKTDRADAHALLSFAREREHPAWQAPSDEVLQLRDATRRVEQLKQNLQRADNRLDALKASAKHDDRVRENLEREVEFLKQQLAAMEAYVEELIDRSEELSETCDLLQTATGIGKVHGPELTAELGVLDPELSLSEVTALAGLDPVPWESGTSISRSAGISKRGNPRIRSSMFRAALVAMNEDPGAERFYNHLTERLDKSGKVALVALARRMLEALWSMLKNGYEWDPEQFCPNIEPVQTA